MKAGNVFLSVVTAAAAGVIGGILFAPEKGSKTRENILAKGEEYSDALKEKLGQVVSTVTHKYEDIKEDAEKLMDKGKSKFNELTKDFKSTNA